MIDPRVKKQAEILVNYSLKVKKGENILIVADFEAKVLALEVYELLIKRGAMEVRVKFDIEGFAQAYFKYASDIQLKHFPKIDEFEIKNVDCFLRILAPGNTRALSGIDADKISLRSVTTQPLNNYRVEKVRWLITRFPSEAQAQEADMALTDYEDFVFNAINQVNWIKKWKEQETLRKLLNKTDRVRIVGIDSDLTLSIKGRTAENCAGEFNMPDGEVFTSVIENSVEGYITYSYPALYMGREFHNVKLEFKRGKVRRAVSDKNSDDLNKILNMDWGARYLGEFGVGNNYSIKKFTKDILFDEKIGGTIHLALGKGYKTTLSRNNSALHWDMIKDLRPEGQLWFDNKLVQKNGKWLIYD